MAKSWAGLPPTSPVRPPRLTTWTGSLRVGPRIVFAILLLSVPTLLLAIETTRELASAPIDTTRFEQLDGRWGNSKTLPLYITIPTLSLADSILTLLLHHNVLLPPPLALATSLLLSIGWIIQLYFWTQCDFLPNSSHFAQKTCYQHFLIPDPKLPVGWVGVSKRVVGVRVGFGVGCAVLYIAWTVIAWIAVKRGRKEAMRRRTRKLSIRRVISSIVESGDEQEIKQMHAVW